ncbi:DUF421 domain-containing protein [Kroppenstedtia pulmonis]|uniref:DUF421 domain-containing protein n=1 Tax=Kroppenstedtia pulmonis TaxID=1380685 RepID=A0A7D4BF16_9BACL|nr:YetF domain-containing protein [Kroppenstedtia pulmonis]QKG84052.1 DUF421 domain-containing protein [Kroppenstedtia pulmonis]
MLIYIGKVFLLFTVAVGGLHIMGKSTRLKVTPHDLVAIVMMAALATNPILVDDLWMTLLAVFLIAVIHLLYAKLTLYKWTNRFLLGEPTILVQHGKIIKANLQRCETSISELLAHIRARGYRDLREVQYVILEPTGELTVLPKDDLYPLTPRDVDLKMKNKGIALSLIVDGQIQRSNLKIINRDEYWLKQQLHEKGIRDIHKVLYAAVLDTPHELYIDDGQG